MTRAGNLIITTPSDREIAMTRVFDAPRALVYQAFTRPALVKQWYGVHGGWTMVVCEIDLRVGGQYRFGWHAPGKGDMAVHGVYREIVEAEKLAATETFDEPWYPGDALTTTVFVEERDHTRVTMTARYDNRDARDAVLRSPMEHGVSAGFDRLAEVLALL
jgi:uncharacterized protein YndB with AHSA1/START domain